MKKAATYKVRLPRPFSGMRYGIEFKAGEGVTGSEWLAGHLRSSGVTVERVPSSGRGGKTRIDTSGNAGVPPVF